MTPSPESVRQQVDRIAASSGFANAERLCRFLRFTVEASLNGEAGHIKEYLLGREVFDRDENYDPRMDPIVRVEARRLRARLEEYYAGAGSADPVAIEFPKGSYAPTIREVAAAPPAKRMRWPWIASAAALVLVAGAAYWTLPARGPSAVAVIPSHWMGEPHALSEFEAGLAEAISAELARRDSPVIAFPSLLRYRRAAKRTRDIAAETGAREILFVSATARGDGSHVVVHLVNAAADRKTWAADYVRGPGDALERQRELARIIAAELALRNR